MPSAKSFEPPMELMQHTTFYRILGSGVGLVIVATWTMFGITKTWQSQALLVAGIVLLCISTLLLFALFFARPQPFTMDARINGGIPFSQWAFTNNQDGTEIPRSQLEHYNRNQVTRWRDLRATVLMAAMATSLMAAAFVGDSSGILQ